MIGKRIKKIRKSLSLSQVKFAEELGASQGQIWSIESGRQLPSTMLLELIICKFDVSRSWLLEGVTTEVDVREQKIETINPNLSSKVMVSAAVLGAVLPQVSVALIAGVGAGHLLDKICQAYGVNNKAELARDCFDVSKSTVSSWLKKDKIPEKYLNKTVLETGVSADFFLNSNQVLRASCLLVIGLIDFLGKNFEKWESLEESTKLKLLMEFFQNEEADLEQRILPFKSFIQKQ